MINLRKQFPHYLKLIRFDRPIGSYLLLWPTLIALWVAAQGVPDLRILLIFVIGTFLMRSAGCAINDYADRDIDAHVERTENRPLASGAISAKEALGVFVVLGLFIGCCAPTRRQLSLYETGAHVAASASRRRLCLGHSHGVYRDQ